jgi:glycosyltransferase involved in cell wall biosynthesis
VRVLVTCERRFKRTPDGSVWTTSTDDYAFWRRYLSVFDEVSIVSRVEDVLEQKSTWKPVEGERVRVVALPNYLGPVEYFLHLPRLRRISRPAVAAADAVVLRIPSHVASSIAPFVKLLGIPFAVEVVGDPYEAFARGAIDHPLRPLLRWKTCREVQNLCSRADAASYVTEFALQRRYPPGPTTYSTHYSSLDILESDLAEAPRDPPPLNTPITVASVGSMELPYKGLGDLVAAAARCVKNGIDIQLLFIGGGRSQGGVIEAVRSEGMEGRVTFTGELPGTQAVLLALRDANLFILASKTEGLPRVMIEAMSQGLPCLGSRVGGIPELLPPECIFEPGDVEGLAAKIEALARNPAFLLALASQNLWKSREFLAFNLRPRREALYRHLRRRAEVTKRKDIRYSVLAPGVLALKTNLPRFSWSYGQNCPSVSYGNYAACKVRMELRKEPRSAFASALRRRCAVPYGKYHYYSGLPGCDEVLYDRPFLFGSRLFLEAGGLLGDSPVVRANRDYFRLVHFRFMNLHSVKYVLTDLATLLLLRNGFLPLHCSAFRLGERTVVVFAPSNSGKTLTTMLLRMEHGAEFLAEDLAVTDGRTLFSVPWTNTFRYYSQVDRRWWSRAFTKAMQVLPFLDLVQNLSRPQSITDLLPLNRMCPSARATDLVILERGEERVAELTTEEACRMAENLNRSEFNYQRSLLTNAHEYFNPEMDVADMVCREKALLRALADGVGRRFLVRTDNPLRYPELVLRVMKDHAHPVPN